MRTGAARLVVGLNGPTLTAAERSFLADRRPLGVILSLRNLESAAQCAALVEEIRAACDPAPLLYVEQEGGPVDRIGPLLGVSFPSAASLAEKGVHRIQECAFLMGSAARLLGFDVDFAPVLDLAQPGTGAVVLAGRCFGFHSEDVVVAGTVFLHGLARAGVVSCIRHFPGLGRGPVDSAVALPVIDAHDVDLMVTDVAPFARLARAADGVLVGHGAYPGFTGDETPASLSPGIHAILRERIGWDGVVYSDDLGKAALGGWPFSERVSEAARGGCDVLVVAGSLDEAKGAADRLETTGLAEAPEAIRRIGELRRRADGFPRKRFSPVAWQKLLSEVESWREELARPRVPRDLDGLFPL